MIIIDSLVEITAMFFDKNDLYQYQLTEGLLWQKSIDDSTVPLISDESIIDGNDIDFTEDNIGLSFRCIGEGNGEGVSSGIESLLEQMSSSDIFIGFEDTLFEMAVKERQKRIDNASMSLDLVYHGDMNFKCFSFITAWEYQSFKSGNPMDGEDWDYNIDILGVVRLEEIAGILEKENQKKILKQVTDSMLAMSKEDFDKMLDEAKEKQSDLSFLLFV